MRYNEIRQTTDVSRISGGKWEGGGRGDLQVGQV